MDFKNKKANADLDELFFEVTVTQSLNQIEIEFGTVLCKVR